MKSIISNPHNGQPVNVQGTLLLPGFSIEAPVFVAEASRRAHEFLAVTTVEGAYKPKKAKPVALKQRLEWSHVTPSDREPGPQFVIHGTTSAAAKVPAPRKVAAKKARR